MKDLITGNSKYKSHAFEALNYFPKDWIDELASRKVGLKSASRGKWSKIENTIFTDSKIRVGNIETVCHEFGHWTEDYIDGIKKAEKEFFDKRTAGLKEERLKDIYPGMGYNANEKAIKDDFIDTYMGKIYGSGYHELVSMGFEYTFTDYKKWEQDEEMRDWILGILCLY